MPYNLLDKHGALKATISNKAMIKITQSSAGNYRQSRLDPSIAVYEISEYGLLTTGDSKIYLHEKDIIIKSVY